MRSRSRRHFCPETERHGGDDGICGIFLKFRVRTQFIDRARRWKAHGAACSEQAVPPSLTLLHKGEGTYRLCGAISSHPLHEAIHHPLVASRHSHCFRAETTVAVTTVILPCVAFLLWT